MIHHALAVALEAVGLVGLVFGHVQVKAGPQALRLRDAGIAAREYLRQYATPTGRIADPVLTIQTTSDPLVLGTDVTVYDTLAAVAGTSDRFVARFVDAKGHCNFTPAQTASAFDALLAWAREGRRPAAGEQK